MEFSLCISLPNESSKHSQMKFSENGFASMWTDWRMDRVRSKMCLWSVKFLTENERAFHYYTLSTV